MNIVRSSYYELMAFDEPDILNIFVVKMIGKTLKEEKLGIVEDT